MSAVATSTVEAPPYTARAPTSKLSFEGMTYHLHSNTCSNCHSVEHLELTALVFNWADSYDAKVGLYSPTAPLQF